MKRNNQCGATTQCMHELGENVITHQTRHLHMKRVRQAQPADPIATFKCFFFLKHHFTQWLKAFRQIGHLQQFVDQDAFQRSARLEHFPRLGRIRLPYISAPIRQQHDNFVVPQLRQRCTHGGARTIENIAQRRLSQLSPRQQAPIHDGIENFRINTVYFRYPPYFLPPPFKQRRRARSGTFPL